MQNSESLSVEWRAIGSIRPYPGNPRRITQAAIDKVASSIKEFGWRQPIVVDKSGEIIAGHTRHQAALKLGLKKVPVHVAKGMSAAKVRAYRLADNRAAEESEWDFPALAIELKGLEAAGFDLSLTAFTDADFARAFADPALPAAPTDVSQAWQGMPECESENQKSFRKIVVHFADQAAVDAFGKLIGQEIKPRQAFLWHPEVKPVIRTDRVYLSEAEKGAGP
jgi:ParB-like chromosome segregation protein Spo0J